MTNRVKIEILGAEYTIATPEEEEYVRRLAREIDAQVSQLLDSDSKLSPNAALILTALSYADSFYKSEQSADHMRSQLSDYLEDAAVPASNLMMPSGRWRKCAASSSC